MQGVSRRATRCAACAGEGTDCAACGGSGCLPRGRGRPRVLQDVKLTSVKMGADHWARLTELAQEAGCSRAEWLRRAIMAGSGSRHDCPSTIQPRRSHDDDL